METSPTPRTARGDRPALPAWLAMAILAGATLALFGDVLFGSGRVLSEATTDLASQYLPWRAFGFGELREGNLALWNPHVYSGSPYLGGFQSALLYPPNWIHLVLPLHAAINWGIALHVFAFGALTWTWARFRGVSSPAAVVAGLLACFGGAFYLHVYAGHLSNLCTMAWIPLVLLAVDGTFRDRSLGWPLLGAAAVALQVLAGHPQYVYYTALVAGLWSLLRLVRCEGRGRIVLGLAGIWLGGAALAAVQLWPGLDAAAEGVRTGGLSRELAAMFALPPESLATLLTPYPFGEGWNTAGRVTYWGRCYLWEVSLFFGLAGLFLALHGALATERPARRFEVTMVVLLALLALGRHTPLYDLLYRFVPRFDQFRATAKFGVYLALFLALLAGQGLDRLVQGARAPRAAAALLFALALGSLGGAWAVHAGSRRSAADPWLGSAMQDLHRRGTEAFEAFLDERAVANLAFMEQAGDWAARSLVVLAGTAALLAVLLLATRRRPRLGWAVALLAVAEVLVAARLARPTFDPDVATEQPIDWSALPNTGAQRLLNCVDHNHSMALGRSDLWGYDPGVGRRYAELIWASQGYDPEQATQYMRFAGYHSIYRMLRCRHALFDMDGFYQHEDEKTLPRVLLVDRFRRVTDRYLALEILLQPEFDPRAEVLLETVPEPAPVPAEHSGQVHLIDSSTDHLTIEAELETPAILVVTDGWAAGWRADPLPGSEQERYEVLPANRVLRAVPLEAGRHRLRMEYRPAAFVQGRRVTAAALLGWLVLAVVAVRRRSAPGRG